MSRAPPQLFTDNKGLSVKAANQDPEEMIALGLGAYDLAIKKVRKRHEFFQECIARTRRQAQVLQGRLNNGKIDSDGSIAQSIEDSEREVAHWMMLTERLSLLRTHVRRSIPFSGKRSIGRVLFADPIGVSSDGPDGFTLDWAVLGIQKDAFDDDFEGNMLYIGTSP